MTLRILALETIGTAGSVAALDDKSLRAEVTLPTDQRSAQALAPAIRKALEMAGWQPRDVQLVAVAIGPGSFTGLRVGVTTAKVFAYAVQADILGIDSHDVIAHQAPRDVQQLWTAIDAQRRQVFCRNYRGQPDGTWLAMAPQRIADDAALLAELSAGSAISGPALTRLAPAMPTGVRVVDSSCWMPRAATVGQLAALQYAGGRHDDVWQLVPFYGRLAAAEEKLASQCDAKQTNGAAQQQQQQQ